MSAKPVSSTIVPDYEEDGSEAAQSSSCRKIFDRLSFRLGNDDDEQYDVPVPTVMQTFLDVYQTPLPILSMTVLSIALLGEFLSANVCAPFLLFMVESFGGFEDNAEVAFWTGVLVSMFFLTQFLTSMIWAVAADKYGRRSVLVVSLFGSAITCAAFGMCTSLSHAICVRLLQGVFAGAVSIARGSVSVVTDASNEGRAYAILGFCWGMGGVAGAIVGGAFETPAAKWPSLFENIPLFVNYPYLLPCCIASAITLTGAVLGCFLAPNGGPREMVSQSSQEKAVSLHPTIFEEDRIQSSPSNDDPNAPYGTLTGTLAQRITSMHVSHREDSPTASSPLLVGSIGRRFPRTRTFSTSRSRRTGSYGYNTFVPSSGGMRRASLASTMRRRHTSVASLREPVVDDEIGLAQRLLESHGDAVASISDLWVAAAMNMENDDVLEDEDAMDSDDDLSGDDNGSITSSQTHRGRPSSTRRNHHYMQFGSPQIVTSTRTSTFPRTSSLTLSLDGTQRLSNLPPVFANPGVPPPAVTDTQLQHLFMRTDTMESSGTGTGVLAPIFEGRSVSPLAMDHDVEAATEKPPSLISQLPMSIILQFGLLALHTTTHDQVFVSYLVSEYDAGGLNLKAGQFSMLIALMCLFQIAYQFYLYPTIGPPRGKLSHLAMFRLGSFLFLPAYITVTMYRVPFASEKGQSDFALMSALTLSTACRFCGNTFAFTAVSILLNYMTPPHAVGIANGIAQSIVSLARCLGPIFGGWLWSVSVEGNPDGYPLGFYVCSAICGAAILHTFFIR